jgi:hypothetical protein
MMTKRHVTATVTGGQLQSSPRNSPQNSPKMQAPPAFLSNAVTVTPPRKRKNCYNPGSEARGTSLRGDLPRL